MKKSITIAAISLSAIIIITRGDILLPVVGFLMTGHIPGTSLIIPFWAMMALYCLTITAIVTLYIEGVFSFIRRDRVAHAHKTKLPRRRYGNV